jgi:hypothetical protein
VLNTDNTNGSVLQFTNFQWFICECSK